MNSKNGTFSYRTVVLSILCVIVAFAFTLDDSFAASGFSKKAKVTGVKTRVVAYRTVMVSWKKMAGADGYVVYYSKSRFGKYVQGAKVAGKSGKARVKGLKFGKKYYFKVRSFKGEKGKKIYGKYSKKVRCVVGPAIPRLTALAKEPTTNKISLSFEKSKRADGYEIWRATKKNGKYKKIKKLSAGKTKFTNTGLKANKEYFYKIRPFAKVGGKKVYSGFSAVVGEYAGGNTRKYDLKNIKTNKSALKGRRIMFLGSSVTYGSGSVPIGISFVDYLKKKDGVDVVAKEAVSGKTLSFVRAESYCERLEKYGAGCRPELLVCQLSSNDAKYVNINNIRRVENPDSGNATDDESVTDTLGIDDVSNPGEVTGTVEYDDDEILNELRANASSEPVYIDDAIKYIIAYSNLKLGCPVVFYVLPPFKTTKTFNAEFYKEMRGCLINLQKTWAHKDGNVYAREFDVEVIDMWENSSFASFNNYDNNRAFYMRDSVHPTKAGYYKKYLPVFENYLPIYLKKYTGR